MKFFSVLSVLCLLTASQVLSAAGQGEHRYTPRDQVKFSPSTTATFDHSGDRVKHITLPGGAQIAEHNGTMGSVTVARIGPDGTMETFCTSDEQAARAWMAGEDIGQNKALSTASIVVK